MKLKLYLPILLLLSSCATNDLSNFQFQKQYNSSLEGMRARREMSALAFENSQSGVKADPSSANISSQSNISNSSAAQLPEDMFDINYDTEPFLPFNNVGGDFDAIKIPATDSYNVKTEVSDKPYLLVDAASIQGSVDKIKSQRSAQDIANSEILISEIKKITREEKMLNVTENKKDKKLKKDKVKKPNFDEEVIVYDNPNKNKDSSSSKNGSKNKKS